MDSLIKFVVKNQRIERVDNFYVVAGSRNYLYAEFDFQTPEWQQSTSVAVFHDRDKTYKIILNDNSCLAPSEWLKTSGLKFVSVYSGDLVTSNKSGVYVYESGYGNEDGTPTPDLLQQIIAKLDTKADGIQYENGILYLMSGDKVLSQELISVGDVSFDSIGEAINKYLEENPIQEKDPTVPEWAKQEEPDFVKKQDLGNGLRVTDAGKVVVDTADSVEQDNTKPITSATVYTVVGNIEALLSII